MVDIKGIIFRPLHFLQKPRQSDQASQFEQLNRIKVFLQVFSLNSQWSITFFNFSGTLNPQPHLSPSYDGNFDKTCK